MICVVCEDVYVYLASCPLGPMEVENMRFNSTGGERGFLVSGAVTLYCISFSVSCSLL